MLPIASFGSTGHRSSRIIFGAAALGGMSVARAEATLELISNQGINHIDTAASYGASEDRLKPWLARHRHEVFLATKTGERTGDAARAELERSLERMGVDHVDMIQLHNLVEPDEWETAFAKGGAVEALSQARSEGLARFIGVTGHGLRIASQHVKSLQRFHFDAVLFPLNHSLMTIPEYTQDVQELMDVCRQRNVAMQTIKAIARRRWEDGPSKEDVRHRSWYEPLTDASAIDRAVRFVLSQDDVFLNTTSDATLLPAILEAASGDLVSPADIELEQDRQSHDMAPLFDGLALERI
jgi:aryl-alcohol dehydrogenase-like predicted oxidoreductase